MVIKMIQTASAPNPCFTLEDYGTIAYNQLDLPENRYSYYFNPHAEFARTGSLQEATMLKIYDAQGNKCGGVGYGSKPSGAKLFGIIKTVVEYYAIDFRDEHYAMYQFGDGHSGMYLFLWKDDNVLVGAARIAPAVINGLHQAELYLDEDIYLPALIFGVLKFIYINTDPFQQTRGTANYTVQRTAQTPALMQKVDMNFINDMINNI